MHSYGHYISQGLQITQNLEWSFQNCLSSGYIRRDLMVDQCIPLHPYTNLDISLNNPYPPLYFMRNPSRNIHIDSWIDTHLALFSQLDKWMISFTHDGFSLHDDEGDPDPWVNQPFRRIGKQKALGSFYGSGSMGVPSPKLTNIAPENGSSQKEASIPTIRFQGIC